VRLGAGLPYIHFCIAEGVKSLWRVEIEPEVRQWLELLTDAHYDKTERAVDMLLAQPTTLGEPQQTCEADHGPAEHSYDRKKEEESP